MAAYTEEYTEDFDTPSGARGFDLIFSTDFTGKVGRVSYDGSKDESQSFGNGIDPMSPMPVIVTTGSVRVAITS